MEETNDWTARIRQRLESLRSLTTADIRSVRREFSKQLKPVTAEFVIRLALNLLKQEAFVPRFFAYELVQHHQAAARSLKSGKLKLLGAGINSWGAVDTFACYLAGPAWREGQVPDSLIERWAHAKDRWWRRAAVVSTVALNNKARGGRGDVDRTLQICQLVVRDRDDMVVKALSWALRELSKRDSASVKEFLIKNQTALAPLVVREVNNKLKTGLKNPRSR
jgi:3-methyladenine DNA glycosylase AlkD